RFSFDARLFHFPNQMSLPEAIIQPQAEAQQVMIELRNVYLSFGDRQILDNISLTVNAGSSMAILGNSGAGKSTILKLILGLMKPNSGEVYVDGEEITSYNEGQLMHVRQKLGMVFQE